MESRGYVDLTLDVLEQGWGQIAAAALGAIASAHSTKKGISHFLFPPLFS